MTGDDATHEDRATEARAAGAFVEAGEQFERAADEYLQEPNLRVAWGLYYLLHATVCFRLAGATESVDRCVRRGLDATDRLRSEVVDEGPEVGMTHEFAGDFKVVGGRDDYEDDYHEAGRAYVDSDVAYDISWHAHPLFDQNLWFFDDLVDAAGVTVPEYVGHRVANVTRVLYKREELPGIVAGLVESGRWE